MSGFPSPLSGSSGDVFDEYDAFVPDHLPEPGPFLDEAAVLSGDDHVTFHRLTRTLFEERGVYDMTFGYNLARLNLDHRHPNAGFRYAEEPADGRVLRAEFTPTTPFCPQSHTLTIGAFRAWNGHGERHEYDCVRVRVAPMHQRSAAINDELARLESEFRETGRVRPPDSSADAASATTAADSDAPTRESSDDRPARNDTPF